MQHIDFQEYIEDEKPTKVLVLHHWDTDGLACAALFLNYLQDAAPHTRVELMCPTINNYFLVEEEYARIAGLNVDAIVTCDINFPLDVIERLEQLSHNVFVFDHHAQTAHIGRPGVQDTHYPGCSMLVNDYLMQPLSLVAVLGMVGDQEDRIQEYTDFYPQVEEMMKECGLTFEEVLRITKLIDTTYIVGTANDLAYPIQLLRKNPESALVDPQLLENEKKIAQEYARECAKEMEDVGKGMMYMAVESPLSLISEVTRAQSKKYPDNIILTSHIRGADASFYVRRRNAEIDLGCVVTAARAQGFNAGGKPEVAGVVLPAVAVPTFTQTVIELLEKKL